MATKAEFDVLIEKIESHIDFYERMSFSNNSYTMHLANGDILSVKFPKSQIPHLLGVNIDYLKSKGKIKSTLNIYDGLKYFIENSYSFYRSIVSGELDYNMVFSKNINEKLDCFISNIRLRTDDLEYIVKYDREKTYVFENKAEIADFYIVRKLADKSIITLGLVKSEIDNRTYLPTSSRCYKDKEEFKEFISRIAKKQELTYCYLMYIDNHIQSYEQKIPLNIENKIAALEKVITESKRLDATPAVSKDFLFSINKVKDSNSYGYANTNVLWQLVDCIKNKQVFTSDMVEDILGECVEMSNVTKSLIDACNDYICSSGAEVSESVSASYSEVCDENKRIKEELESYKEMLENLKKEVDDLTTKNSILEEKEAKSSIELRIYEEAYAKVLALRS